MGFPRLKALELPLLCGHALLIFVFTCLIVASGVHAKDIPMKINFQQVLEGKDIVIGEVEAVFQDRDGFMWFGGRNGLFRYDGYEFKELLEDERLADGSTQKESVKAVTSIYQDEQGNVWIATRSGTLLYDAITTEFFRIRNADGSENLLSTANFEQLIASPTGEILGAGYNGLGVINPSDFSANIIWPTDSDGNQIENAAVSRIFVEGDTVWLGTHHGLIRVDWKSRSMRVFSLLSAQYASGEANRVTGIAKGEDGEFWLGTTQGLVKYNLEKNEIKRFVNDPADNQSLSNNAIWDIFKDSQGLLWVATDQGGLNLYNPNIEGFVRFQHKIGSRGSLSSNVIRTVYEDRTGDLWVGTYPEGLNYFDRSSTAITSYSASATDKNSLSHNSILAIREDAKGNLWLGSDGGGLNYFDRAKQTFTHFKNDPTNENSISSNAILSSWLSDEGEIWVGTWGGGISKFNSKTKQFDRIPYLTERVTSDAVSTSDKLSNAHVWCIYQDSQKYIWVCTHDGGLNKYNPKTKMFTHYMVEPNNPNTLESNMIWTVFEDSYKNFWVGTAAGLHQLDRETDQFRVIPSSFEDPQAAKNGNVLSFFEDSKGRVWQASSGGLQLYIHETKEFKIFGKKDGFLDESTRSVLEDYEGNLWVGTDNGITRFNPETKEVKNYNRANGRLMGGLNSKSAAFTKNGELVFGGINGLRIINADKLKANTVKPQVVLTDFKIFAESIPVGGEENILPEALNRIGSITLDYTKSMFEFSFAALNYRDTEKNRYAYRLEGFDKGWLKVGAQRTAKYTNLDSGRYVFHVKGSNNDGVWNEEGHSIEIIQLPAPWRTWWAYTIYVMLMIAAIAGFVYWQFRKRQIIEEQNRILEQKVAERTRELKQKNDDVERMLSNIHQGLFTIEDGGQIHHEYSVFLEDIFQTKDIAGRDAMEFLFTNAHMGSDRRFQIIESMHAMVGEHQMNFDFNAHLLPYEVVVDINGEAKNLCFEWDPIVEDQFIDKMMVTVRDVTMLKKMESEAASKERELSMISQLLNLPARKYNSFMESSAQMIDVNRELLSKDVAFSRKLVDQLFRNIHTIKGNARTHKFTYISETAHELETELARLRDSTGQGWNKELLLEHHVELENVITDYIQVYENVLGRNDNASVAANERGDGYWVSTGVVDRLMGFVDSKNLYSIRSTLEAMRSDTFEEVLSDIVGSLPVIAHELGKAAPEVNLKCASLLLQKPAQTLVVDVFTHILRNCIDHGIETKDERLEADKPEKGKITINAYRQAKLVQLVVSDDGRGMNISRLFDKGVELDMWRASDKVSPQKVAELVFSSGVSTKEQVTDISGRGVGMDAVKQFLMDKSGDINVSLLNDSPNADGFIPFELIISLPSSLFVFLDVNEDVSTNHAG